MAQDPLIAFVQFEHDGRPRATGAFQLPDWPLRRTPTPALAVDAARNWLVDRGGHYPVMVASRAMGANAAPTTEVDEHFRKLRDLSPQEAQASLAVTRELATAVRRPGLPKPGSQFCARLGCQRPATFERPLCHPHWKEWDAYELAECARCHWLLAPDFNEAFGFSGLVEERSDVGFHCDPCLAEVLHPDEWPWKGGPDRERLGEVPVVLAHAPLVRVLRYVYILKLDGGEMYVGQTPNLVIRMQEHRDGLAPSTKGKHPRLVYFETYEGEKARVTERENELTLRNLDGLGRRRLREMVENFQAPLRLVDFNA